jgi:hypothetical protein
MATIDYKVNYEDERFQQVEDKHQDRVNDLEQTYAGIIGGAENIYQPQIDALEQWGDKQAQLQQERTDLTIQQIEQQKAQARQDYQKEQSGAYVDWRKQSNQYGTEAEKMASSGLMDTGFSESSQVGMYNTYQNRVAQARESYDRVIMNYNNSINEAKLQNNSALAEIAFNTLTKQLELITEGTMYKNDLILQLADKKMQLEQMRDNNWYKVLDQINTENALAEDVRQFDENIKFQTTQAELDRQFQAKQAEIERQYKERQAALDRQHDFALLKAKTEEERKLAIEAHNREMDKLAQQHRNDLAILEKQYEISKRSSSASISKGSGSSSSSKGSSSSSSKGSSSTVSKTGSSSTKKTTVDTDSVLALGQGPISASNLASQVASGKVKATTTNGKTTFSYNYPSANPLNKAGGALNLDAPWKKKK